MMFATIQKMTNSKIAVIIFKSGAMGVSITVQRYKHSKAVQTWVLIFASDYISSYLRVCSLLRVKKAFNEKLLSISLDSSYSDSSAVVLANGSKKSCRLFTCPLAQSHYDHNCSCFQCSDIYPGRRSTWYSEWSSRRETTSSTSDLPVF